MRAVLESSIDNYQASLDAWRATETDGNLDTEDPAYQLFAQAEYDLVCCPCGSDADVRRKVRHAERTREMRETLELDRDADGNPYLLLFLKSLSAAWPVDSGEIGEKP
ncbi:hypothetical protein [Pararhizobium qamdonense]|uniref:hypothetical protein n=1 Tax=Pararhizobium qamdonense TaxID=3031126 RepID=UPI0023E09882|nr:hypothetical protein [Pararhizobium qamdonense]